MITPATPARFLASVTGPEEALIAHLNGAHIIDAKDPARGALGALDVATVTRIRASLPASVIVSATIGDLPADPVPVVEAVRAMAASGCDLIKIGMFPGGDPLAMIAALGRLGLQHTRLAGLLLADASPDLSLIPAMARANFAGVMLDTAGKAGGALTDQMDLRALAGFIARAKSAHLFAGLAGSLQLSHIAQLMPLLPNVIGFRGALCERGVRTGGLFGPRVAEVAHAIGRHGTRTGTLGHMEAY